MARVVNARRGMYEADGRLFTREATTARGTGRAVRLMPEQILRDAADRDDAIRLLRAHGYITGTARPATQVAVQRFRPVPQPEVAPPRIRMRPETPPVAAAPAPPRTFDDRVGAAATEAKALQAVPAGLARRGEVELTAQQADALREYESSYYISINGKLRRDEVNDLVRPIIGHIDTAMDASRLAGDVQVWRGITSAEKLFGDRLDGDLVGFQWREAAYTSTSASRKVAKDFLYEGTGAKSVQMRILAPAGTPAVRISEMGIYDQAEILLGRGQRFRVVADRGVSPEGVRLVDVEVIGD